MRMIMMGFLNRCSGGGGVAGVIGRHDQRVLWDRRTRALKAGTKPHQRGPCEGVAGPPRREAVGAAAAAGRRVVFATHLCPGPLISSQEAVRHIGKERRPVMR